MSTKIEVTDTSFNQHRPHRDCLKGLVKYIGLSNVSRDQFNAATRIVDISAVTTVYNIAVGTGSARITAAEARGVMCSPASHPVAICDAGPDEYASPSDRGRAAPASHGDRALPRAHRTPTLLATLAGREPAAISAVLAQHGVNAPAGSFYAYEAARRLGLAEAGGVRIGLAPYNSADDVDRLFRALTEAVTGRP